MPAPELEVVLENTEPTALLAEDAFAQTAREAGERPRRCGSSRSAARTTVRRALLDGAPRACAAIPIARCGAPLLIINTSGTTGPPKGAVITGEALHFNALNVAAAVGIGADDEVLANGPLFNTGPMNILTTPALAAGATVTILREFDPGAIAGGDRAPRDHALDRDARR